MPMVSLAITDGLNSLVSDLNLMRYIHCCPRSADLAHDLAAARRMATADVPDSLKLEPGAVYLGGRYETGLKITADKPAPNSHPYRLWLYSRIMQAWLDDGEVDDSLIQQAVSMRLVTPVTGAVVLETEEQYARNDLDPTLGSDNVPKIPEPEFYILLGLAVLSALIWMKWRRRTPCGI